MNDVFAMLLETFGEVRTRRIVDTIGPQSVKAFIRYAAEARTRTMLAEGKTLCEVAHRLKGRYDVSIETAYRWLREMEKA